MIRTSKIIYLQYLIMDNDLKSIISILNYSKDILKSKKKSFKNLKKSLSLLSSLDTISETNTNELYSFEIKDLINDTKKEFKKKYIFKLIKENNYIKIKNENINFNMFDTEGNTVLHYAIKIGDCEILRELFKKGGKIDTVNKKGNTLIEYACLQKDPNLINFLKNMGANIEKTLYFREGNKIINSNNNDIDLSILLKILIFQSNKKNNNSNNRFNFLLNYFNNDDEIGINNYKFSHIILGLNNLFKNINIDIYNTIKNIILEELDYYNYCKSNNIFNCYEDKINIILISLVPFINYPFNVSTKIIIFKELEFLFLKLKNKNNYKNLIFDNIKNNYIDNKLFTEDFIGIILYQIFKKNKF